MLLFFWISWKLNMNKFKVFISKNAQNDITEISDYIAKDSLSAAQNIVLLFKKTFELLAEYPQTGTIKEKLGDGKVRVFAIKKNFSIIYKLEDDAVIILRVLTRYQNIFAVL